MHDRTWHDGSEAQLGYGTRQRVFRSPSADTVQLPHAAVPVRHAHVGAASNAGSYACNPLPASCGATPTCACLTGTAVCGNCTVSAAGDLNTLCLLP